MSIRRLLAGLVGFGLVVILASPSFAQDKEQKKPKRERNRISHEELVEVAERFSDLYQAVQGLRPHFLSSSNRGSRTTGVGEAAEGSLAGASVGSGGSRGANAKPVVYIDGRKSGDPETLRGILSRDVEEVRYLTPNEAGMEYGLGHEAGAILVKVMQGPRPPG